MRKWMALMLAVALCLSMVSCGKKEKATAETQVLVEDFSSMKLRKGSQMPNFSIRDVDGNAYTLYEVLEEKQMVLLNFWFVDCPYCVLEFPFMDGAYRQYVDSVAVFALNPFDTAADILAFRQQESLCLTMCAEDLGMRYAFGVSGYPTTVIIDRYGVVCLVQPGAVIYEDVFLKVFAHFTAEDYETELFDSMAEIVA